MNESEPTEPITTVEALLSVIKHSRVSLSEVGAAVGLTRQGLQHHIDNGSIDGLTGLAMLKAALTVTERRRKALRDAVTAFSLE